MGLDELLDYSTNSDPLYMNNRQNTLKSLYSLSLGWFWFELNGKAVPQAHPDFKQIYPDYDHSPGIDYQVLQLFSDLEEFMPVVLNPLPSSLSEVIRTGAWAVWKHLRDEFRDSLDWKQTPEVFRETVSNAANWWNWRKLEMWYLVAPPSPLLVARCRDGSDQVGYARKICQRCAFNDRRGRISHADAR